ncbi:MAG TPA: hypothetical protein VGC57_13390 [Cellulomonas sp.]
MTTTGTLARPARHAAPARVARPALVPVIALGLAVGTAVPALAYWTATGSASPTTSTATLSIPVGTDVPATAADTVAVSWTAGAGGVVPDGYAVTRTTGGTVSPACASSRTVLITGTTCTDTDVPAGEHTYAVTAVYRSWTAQGAASTVVSASGAAAAGRAERNAPALPAITPSETPTPIPVPSEDGTPGESAAPDEDEAPDESLATAAPDETPGPTTSPGGEAEQDAVSSSARTATP